MIIFLDFDGVLHPFFPMPDLPNAANAYFANWPRLLRVLNDHPEVQLVVSSSWRSIMPEKWDAEVPEPLRARITGYTPEIKRPLRRQYPTGYTPEPIRYLEILRYLRTNRREGEPWIALDDDATLFPVGCPNLILCSDGFREAEEAALRAALTRATVKPLSERQIAATIEWLHRAHEKLKERAAGADITAAQKIPKEATNVPPAPGDELPDDQPDGVD
jgi:hypothetical protein